VNVIVAKGADYAVLKVSFDHADSHSKALDVDLVVDLADPQGAEAYDKAIKGDLTTAHTLHHLKHTAVKSWSIVNTLTDDVRTDASLSLFKLITLNGAVDNGHVHEVVVNDAGVQSSDTFTHHRQGSWLVRLFGGGDRELNATAQARTVRALGSPTARGLHLHVDFTRKDQKTSADDVADRLALAREFFGDAPQAPSEKKKRYGATNVSIAVEMGDKALANILKATDDEYYAAYAGSVWDQHYTWGPSRVRALRGVDLAVNERNTPAQEALRHEAWRLLEADEVLKLMHDAQKAKTTTVGKARALRDMIGKNKLELHALIALVHLAGNEDAKVTITIQCDGKTLFEKSAGQATDLPVLPAPAGAGSSGGDPG
jgi:hypothetical protein